MADLGPPSVPPGTVAVAWYSYPSLTGLWRPSKVHLATEERGRPLCGARKARGARYSDGMSDHMGDAGQCSRCLRAAGPR
jgi:hypothetical protein